jgi:UDP-N-acetylmuramoylalanine--D-glutamate ligase
MKELFNGKKVGILGLGSVGKSVLSFISQFDCQLSVIDQKPLDGYQTALLNGHHAQTVDYQFLPEFLEMNDIIIASPGVDIKQFELFQKKFISEIDLFAQLLKKPTIAVTGSVGKTSVVHILTHLLNKLGKKALACGNIGLPLLDAVSQQDKYDILVLELSSFQLQYNHLFAADLALITNFYPNHLDHHEDITEYLEAKGQLLIHQNFNQQAIIPFNFMDEFWSFVKKQNINWIAPDVNKDITQELSDITCHENWQLIIAALEHLQLPTDNLEELCADLQLPEHRVEFIATKNGLTFYNDSKATLPKATLSAVEKLRNKQPLILFLGGLSKGIDRSILIHQLKNKITEIICFGAEAKQLHNWCIAAKIESSNHPTLEAAFEHCKKTAPTGSTILFSPAGASFDLFKNYEERGAKFKELVKSL